MNDALSYAAMQRLVDALGLVGWTPWGARRIKPDDCAPNVEASRAYLKKILMRAERMQPWLVDSIYEHLQLADIIRIEWLCGVATPVLPSSLASPQDTLRWLANCMRPQEVAIP